MRKIGFIFCIVAAIATCSCRNDHQEAFDFDGFRRLKPLVIGDSLLVGRPSRPMILDSLLIYTDKFEGELITVINLNTGSFRRALPVGRGPGEMMMIRRIYHNDAGKIFLFDVTSHKISSYSATESFPQLLSANTCLGEMTFGFDEVPYEVIPFGNGYIANGNFEGHQFSLLDSNGRSTGHFGVYPGDNSDAGNGNAFFMKNQTLMAVKPDQSCFAAAGYSNDQLVFYRTDGSGIPQKTREYFTFDADVETITHEHGVRVIHKPETVSAYMCLYPTDNYLYTSYKGRTMEEMMNPDIEKVNYILKFDWDGEFIEGYVVGNIDDFAVDEAAGRIYAFVYEDGDSILTAYEIQEGRFAAPLFHTIAHYRGTFLREHLVIGRP